MREKEKQLADAKNKLDEQVADQVEEQLKKDRARIAAEEAKKAKQAAATDLEQKTREARRLAGSAETARRKTGRSAKGASGTDQKQRELDDAKRELELTVEKRVQEGLDATRQQAKKEAEDEQKLKVMEKEQTIAAMQKQIEDLKRRAEQGSQQLQGEVQELELENLLRSQISFRCDRARTQGRIRRGCAAPCCRHGRPGQRHHFVGVQTHQELERWLADKTSR